MSGRAHSTMAPVTVAQAVLMSADEGGRMAVDPSLPILVVDDYNTMIRIIRNLLRQLGFEDVDEAPDGSIALSKMHIKRYGLIKTSCECYATVKAQYTRLLHSRIHCAAA